MNFSQFFLIVPADQIQPPFTSEILRSLKSREENKKKIGQFNQVLVQLVSNILATAKEGNTAFFIPYSFIENQKSILPENAYDLFLQKLQEIFPDSSIKDRIHKLSVSVKRFYVAPRGTPHEERGIMLDWSNRQV